MNKVYKNKKEYLIINNNKLQNHWTIITDYEKSLKGFKLFRWKVVCFFDDIHVWLVCKWYKIKILIERK